MGIRQNRLGKNRFYMLTALLAAQQSPDPHTQTGACVVSDGKIIGIGFNNAPKGIDANDIPRKRGEEMIDNKNSYVVHAEFDAIINTGTTILDGCDLFVTLHPCEKCTQLAINCGIKRIIYLAPRNLPFVPVVQKLCKDSGVELVKFSDIEDDQDSILLDILENSKLK